MEDDSVLNKSQDWQDNMGYRCSSENDDTSKGFRVIELTGKLDHETRGKKSFNQILLLNNDLETLLFVEMSLDRVVYNAVLARKHEYKNDDNERNDFKEFCRSFEPLIDAIIMRPEKNLLSRITASLKKAILTIAIDRCKSDRARICNELGLSDRQLDEELRLCGLRIAGKRNKQ